MCSMLTVRRPLTLHEAILRISQTRWNYWFTYAIDLSLMTFFLAWDAVWLGVTAGWMAPSYMLGLAAWSLTEYIFHRCVYHLEWGILSHGHETHHKDPRAYVAMPWFLTPILFIPPQLLVAKYFGVRGFSTFLAGWFGGFIAYSFLHHSLHHYNLRFGWYPASPVTTPDPSCLSGVELRRHDAILGSRVPDRVHQGKAPPVVLPQWSVDGVSHLARTSAHFRGLAATRGGRFWPHRCAIAF